MFKSKLQELCQKKAWSLPEYNTTKQGLDHNPCFEATVIVNGTSFQSQNPARSSKEAQNDAAHLAFLHFTSPPLPHPGFSNAAANSDSNIADRGILQPERQEANRDPQVNEPASICKDMQHLYKNLLQNFAQKRNLGQPVYSCEFEGPPHACRFKCKVTVNEKTYESLEFFPTIKEAEHAAARIALSSLSPDSIEEEDSSLYKNLLQELIQKEGSLLPVYTTIRDGEAHSSTFISTVEVKGEVFTGQRAKTKKQAEFLAAKVAYKKLKECKSNSGSMITTAAYQGREVPVLSSHFPSNFNADTQQNLGPKANTLISRSPTSGVGQQENIVNGAFSNRRLSIPFPQPEMNPDWQSPTSSPSLPDHPVPEYNLSRSNLPSDHSGTPNSMEDSIEQPVEMSTLTCNRVVVCPRVLNMKFPAGSTVMSDENWVAVRIESQPNQ
ncbi:hypothetical protein PTKIN_Ptkin01aG0375900 [Pterospermum kingtungense]